MKKIHFVFAGGGARGAFQLGVAKALMAGGVQPSFIAANSAGSLNAFTISRCGVEYAEKVWRSLKKESDIFSGNFWVQLPWKTGKMSPEPLRKKLQAAFKASDKFAIPFCVTSVSLLTGETRYTHHDDEDIVNMTVASASIPGYVESYQPETFAWSDGGTKENLPLSAALVGSPDLVVCLHCSPEDPRRGDTWKVGNALCNGLRAIEMATEENYKADRLLCGTPGTPVVDVFPEFAVLGPLDFDPAKIAPAIDYGYKRGIAALPRIREILGSDV